MLMSIIILGCYVFNVSLYSYMVFVVRNHDFLNIYLS
jgi:hypothetical protein